MPGRGTPWRGVGKGKQDRIGSGEIEDDSIQSVDIKDLTITNADIADGTISEVKLDSGVTVKLNSAGGHVIQDEGTPLAQRPNMSFVGAGVTASDNGEDTIVTIPSGGGGGWIASRLFPGIGATFAESYDSMFVAPEMSGEQASFGNPMPKAGQIESIRLQVYNDLTTSTGSPVITVRKNGASALTLNFSLSAGAGLQGPQEGPVSFAENDRIDILVSLGGGTGSCTIAVTIEYSFD